VYCVMSCFVMRIIRNFIRPILAVFLMAGALSDNLSAEASRVSIGLEGHIVPKCSLTGATGKLDFGLLGTRATPQERALEFTINCNTPFTYELSAREGALLLHGSRKPVGERRTRLPYSVHLVIPTDNGATLRSDCGGEILVANPNRRECKGNSGSSVAMEKRGTLMVSLLKGDGSASAGIYSDSISFEILVLH
jgi:hypothetical protein